MSPPPIEPDPPEPRLSPGERRRLFVRAVVVGLSAGTLAVAFRAGLERAEATRNLLFTATAGDWWGLPLSAAACAVVVMFGVGLVRSVAPEAAGSGIPHVEGVLHHGFAFRWLRVMWVKAVGGCLAIGGGLSLGREGPTVQIGAAAGAGWGDLFAGDSEQRKTLVAVGAGAGLAAAFNAPLAGMAFVFEELRGGLRPSSFLAALLATASADYIARGIFGQYPAFGALQLGLPALGLVPLALVLGAVGGLLGVLVNAGLFATLTLFERLRRTLGGWGLGAACGAIVGAVGWVWPDAVGNGHPLIERALAAPPVWTVAVGLGAARAILTLGSYAAGPAGGLFTPLLVMGAYSGSLWIGLLPPESPAALVVVLGMVALFTGSVRAPVTGVLLMIEMTGSYALILPLLATALAAEYVAGELGGQPVYSALLDRDLERRRSETRARR